MEYKVKIHLSSNTEIILRETKWNVDDPEIPKRVFTDSVIDDMIATGLLFKNANGSHHLTYIGEEILNHLQKNRHLMI